MSNLTVFKYTSSSKLMNKVEHNKYSEYYYNIFETILNNPITEKKQKHFQHIKLDNIDDLGTHTLQKFTIDKIKEHVYPLKTYDNLCIAGGVAYNGYMNEEFTKHYENVFVPPAEWDEGPSVNTYMHADCVINNNIHKSETFVIIEYDTLDEIEIR